MQYLEAIDRQWPGDVLLDHPVVLPDRFRALEEHDPLALRAVVRLEGAGAQMELSIGLPTTHQSHPPAAPLTIIAKKQPHYKNNIP